MITKLYLEQLLIPYSKAPVEYPGFINPKLIDYMKYQHQKIKDSSNFADAWHHLLVGQMKIIYTILCENNIDSTAYKGSLDWKNKKNTAQLCYHFWLDVEPYRIDYRGRFWYQLDFEMQHLLEQVPCGVFLPSNFPDVIYQGQAVEIKPLALGKL